MMLGPRPLAFGLVPRDPSSSQGLAVANSASEDEDLDVNAPFRGHTREGVTSRLVPAKKDDEA